MAMDYLYFLQQLREAAPHWVNETILFISEFIGGTGGLVLMALIYWCISKSAGTALLMNFSMSQIVNCIVKNSCQVERPFNRDDRLTPYTPVKGYSFPSGHTMMAASFYGSVALWQRKRKWLMGLCVFMALFTGFTRNWLGAHTLEDVLVGILLSGLLIVVNALLLNMVEKHPQRDVWVLIGAVALCVGYSIAFPYSLRAVGMYGGVMLGWFIERRLVRFEICGGKLFRLLTFVSGIAIVGVCYKVIFPAVFAPLGADLSGTLCYFFVFMIITALWPAVIKLLSRKFVKEK